MANRRAGKRAVRLRPIWDAQRHELRFRGRVLREFDRPAARPDRLLKAFQAEGWQDRILNPFSPEGHRSACDVLNDTVRNLNRDLPLIRFGCEGKGTFATWRLR